MFTRIGLPLIAFGLLTFAIMHVAESQKTMPSLPPPMEPPRNPFPNTVAGAGIIEPETENIAVGSPLSGIVAEVMVKVGQTVKPGDALFRLDDRHQLAELDVRKAVANSAKAELNRLEAEPRVEKVLMAEAQMHEAEARLVDARERWNRAKASSEQRIFSEEESLFRLQNFLAAESQVERAKADYQMTKQGAWEFEKAIAREAYNESLARVKQVEMELDRLFVRASVQGEVLQVNVRPGEFVGAPAPQPLIVLGQVQQLHVRVDIDEYDIPRFRPGATARATLKGHPGRNFDLEFVRIEPYVVPKKSLTGLNTERVDTRVLQVIYHLQTKGEPFFVGQQLDVFIEGPDREANDDINQ